MAVRDTPAWADHAELLSFYTQSRSQPDDLYPSEYRFLPWLARQATSVLDAGCAGGGFSNIWHHYQPDLVYTGIDISASLIEAAKKLRPELRFLHGNVTAGIALVDRYATIVQALGWLHWEPEYLKAIAELWRLMDRYLFLDVRLVAHSGDAAIARQKLAFTGEWDGETTTPYVMVVWSSFAALLLDLQPTGILGYGYWGRPAETVIGGDQQIWFATFVLERGPSGEAPGPPLVCLDLPLFWPAALAEHVELLPTKQLEILAPKESEPSETVSDDSQNGGKT